MAGEKRRLEAATVRPGAVRCSAWLGVAGLELRFSIRDSVEDVAHCVKNGNVIGMDEVVATTDRLNDHPRLGPMLRAGEHTVNDLIDSLGKLDKLSAGNGVLFVEDL